MTYFETVAAEKIILTAALGLAISATTAQAQEHGFNTVLPQANSGVQDCQAKLQTDLIQILPL
jgi:hypothetical protein